MITPVNLKLAKSLKEKGFDEECRLCVEDGDKRPLPFNCGNTLHRNSLHPYYSAPTTGEVLMWLYENHGIWVYTYSVAPYILEKEEYPKIVFVSKVQKFKEFDIFINTDNGLAVNHYKTPTEAYEAGIKYCLEKII